MKLNNPYPETIIDEASGVVVLCSAHGHWQEGFEAHSKLIEQEYEPVELEVSHLPQIRGELENFAKDVIENYQKTGLVYPSTLGNVAKRIATIAKNSKEQLYRKRK